LVAVALIGREAEAQSTFVPGPGTSSWENASLWSPSVPNAPGAEAIINNSSRALLLTGTGNVTIGILSVNRTSAFEIGQIGATARTLIFDSGAAATPAEFNASGGATVTVSGPHLRLDSDLVVNVTGAATVLRLQNSSATSTRNITGSGDITKTGDGTLIIARGGNFSGVLTIQQGLVRIEPGGGLGASGAGSGTVVTGGGLVLNGVSIGAEHLTLDSTSLGLATTTGTTNVWGGPVSLAQASRMAAVDGAMLTITGAITGAGNTLRLGGGGGQGGTVLLSGNNTGIAEIIVASGTLSLGSDNAAGGATIRTTGSVIDYAAGVTNPAPIVIASNTTRLQVLAGAATQSGVISEDVAGRPLEKIGDGTLTLSAANTFTGPLTVSAGTLALDATGRLATGSIEIAPGAAMETATGLGDGLAAASSLVVENSGSVTATGGADSPAMIGRVGVTTTFNNRAGGTVNGMAASNAGAGTLIVNNVAGAAWTAPAGGTATLAGPDDRLNNSGTFNMGAGATLTGWESVINDGTLNMAAGSTLGFAGLMQNTGTITVTGTATLGGSVNNTGGTIAMADGVAGDVLNVTGDLTGGTIQLDVDVSVLNAGIADRVVVTGNVAGPVALALTQLGGISAQAAPIVLLSGADLTGAAITATGLPSSGAYLTELDITPTTAALVVRVNPAVGNVSGALGMIDAMTMRSLARPAEPMSGCTPGGWAQAVAARGQGRFNSTVAGTTTQARATIAYEGLLAGAGLGCAEIGGGWQIAGGLQFGVLNGRTSQVSPVAGGGQIDIGSTFQRASAGAAFTAIRDRLAIDVGLDAAQTRLRFSETVLGGGGGVGIAGAAMSTTSLGASLRVSWRMDVGDGVSFVPMAGISMARNSGGSVAVGPAGAPTATMAVAPHVTRMAMAGGRLERERASASGTGSNRQYLTLAVYSDQSAERRTTVTPTGGGAPSVATTGNLGTFAELGIGFSASRVVRGRAGAPGMLDTWLRADLRGSDRLDNTTVSAGLMLRF
ncbi:MAG: autotransporter-associated beta strand repeat-containing protein, partial [Rhodobacteraceae bacterium]|nr:autotransporter-associated beta strand repeat-containing protein [Paracoccaceae bacterium]